MNNKIIIILDGVSEGKTQFIEIAKRSGAWTWNLNFRNVLSMLSHKLGWDGERTKEYYAFLSDFENLANNFFDSENWYIDSMLEKFSISEKANVLIIHNAKEDLKKRLESELENCFSINISDKNIENVDYCKTLNYKDDGFTEEVIRVLGVLLNDKEKGE